MTVATGERLQKVLARVGVGSRRVCEELIADGRVTVNGEVAVLGRRVDPAVDRVEVDGVPLPVAARARPLPAQQAGRAWSARPRTPTADPRWSPWSPTEPRVFPVGRLDMDSEGLLILTNDGELTYRLTHPSFGVRQGVPGVRCEGEPTSGQVRRLRQGVDLDDGPTAPARVAVVAPGLLRIVIHEGRNRQVRRMCEAVGHPVIRLVRTRIGPLADPSPRPGHVPAARPSTRSGPGRGGRAGGPVAPERPACRAAGPE